MPHMLVMTDTFREFGTYSQAASAPVPPAFALGTRDPRLVQAGAARPAGSVEPWAAAKSTMPGIMGDEALVRSTWENFDSWSYAFLWHSVVSF